MATPATQIPEFQDDLVFGTPDVVAREATRYLFLSGDVIAPRRKQERKDFANGGEEVNSPCMWRSRYFLRRGRITPLEYGARWDIAPRTPDGVRPIAVVNHGGNPSILEDSTLVGIPAYPGEAIASILDAGDEGMRMGIVELIPLRGISFADVEAAGYQKLFFPSYPNLPVTLRELVDTIKGVKSVESIVKELQEQMLASCEMFSLYGSQKVEQDHQLMRQPAVGGHVFGYSPLSETLIPQLEIPRQDQGQRTMAQLTGKLTDAVLAGQTQQGPDMERLASLISTNQEALVAAMMTALAPILAGKGAEIAETPTKKAVPVKKD